MEFTDVMAKRICIRHFEKREVPIDILEKVLLEASRAPSSKNTQPWQIDVVSGETLDEIRTEFLEKFDAGEKPIYPYEYSIEPLPDLYMARARQVGFSLFEHKGIDRKDYPARQAHNRLNFEFFGAPVVIWLSLPQGAQRGNFLDVGLFLQNLMLSLVNQGMGSCPMFSAVSYPEVLRKKLNRPEDVFVCGLALGYADNDPVNDFKTERAPLNEWTRFYN